VTIDVGMLADDALMQHGPHAVRHDRRLRPGIAIHGVDPKPADADIANGRFRQAKKDAGGMGKAMNIHVFHGDAVDLWRTVVDSGRFARLHPVVMAISIAVVIAIGGKRGQNAIHADAAHGYAADRSAPPAPRLYPQAAVGADHLAILYADVM